MRQFLLSLLFVFSSAANAVNVGFAWDPGEAYPPNTTYEFQANECSQTGLTSTSVVCDLVQNEGGLVSAQVRAVPEDLVTYSPSAWTTLSASYEPLALLFTNPAVPTNLAVNQSGGGSVAFSPVGTAVGTSNSASATSIASPAKSTTTGNFLFVAISKYQSSTTINSVTDTAGNTYVRAGTTYGGDSNHKMDIFYTPSPITGNANNVATANFSGSSAFRVIAQAEFSYSGATGITFDSEASGKLDASATTTHTTNSTTVNDANDLLLTFFIAWDATITISSWTTGTELIDIGPGDAQFAYNLPGSTGSKTMSGTTAIGSQKAMILKAFTPTVSGGTGLFIINPDVIMQAINTSTR